MNLKDLKEIVKLMKEAKLTELEVEEGEFKVKLKKGGSNGKGVAAQAPVMIASQAPAPVQAAPVAAVTNVAPVDDGLYVVKSPMVGTYYEAPAPNEPPFISVGKKVKVDDTLCILEAMKLMNEIKSEVSGEIVEILVTNGQAIEFDQPLFKLKQ